VDLPSVVRCPSLSFCCLLSVVCSPPHCFPSWTHRRPTTAYPLPPASCHTDTRPNNHAKGHTTCPTSAPNPLSSPPTAPPRPAISPGLTTTGGIRGSSSSRSGG